MKSPRRLMLSIPVLAIFTLLSLALFSCKGKETKTGSAEVKPARETAPRVLKLATTTSTDNSGLLDYLLPMFEKKYNVKVRVIAVGTGKALELGRNGDVDVVLVHSRKDEDEFVASGAGVDRRDVMYNDFVILGPDPDPAGIRGLSDLTAVMKRIAEVQAPFVSRGDDSGTFKKELDLWAEAGINPGEGWYMETGQGMGPTLTIADEKNAYTLSDRGTFIAYRKKIGLGILFEGDPELKNPYGIIAVNPERFKTANYQDAENLIDWITSPEGRKAIADFKINGEVLFFPNAQ